jgi:hypothetical protein
MSISHNRPGLGADERIKCVLKIVLTDGPHMALLPQSYLAWPIHESRRLQMRGAEGEAVLILVKKRVLGLRTLRNKADAAGSARPEDKNAGSFETKLGKPNGK